MKCNLCQQTDGELRSFDGGTVKTVKLSMKVVQPNDHYTETTIEARDFALCDMCRMSLWDGLRETLCTGLKLAEPDGRTVRLADTIAKVFKDGKDQTNTV